MNNLVDNLIGPAEACQMLGANKHSLLRGINDGIVPAYSIDGAVRFRPSELRHPALSGLDEYYRSKDEHFAA